LACIRVDPAAFDELLIDLIDIGHYETKNRAIDRICPLAFVGPLYVQLHGITPDGDVLRVYWSVLKDHRKPKSSVEAQQRFHIGRSKNRMHRLKISSHGPPRLGFTANYHGDGPP